MDSRRSSSSSSSSSSDSTSSSIPSLVALPDSTPASTRNFHLFKELPIELRSAIWKQTLAPRVVEMHYKGIGSDGGFTSPAEAPIALQVCKESRELVEEWYPLCFGSIFHPAHTRFNFATDTLFLSSDFEDNIPHFLGVMTEGERAKLSYLAIESDILAVFPFRDVKTPLKQTMTKFVGIKQLLIVSDVTEKRDIIHTDDDSAMTIYDELPAEIKNCKELGPDPIVPHAHAWVPDTELLEDMEVWPTPRCRHAWGWRRCTCTKVIDSDSDDDDDSDEDDDDEFGWEDEDDYDSDDMFPPGMAWMHGPMA